MLNALGLGYSEVKIKPYLKMAVQRIQIANNKKLTSVKHQKREIAALLGEQKDEKARIKVEHIIRDDFMIEAYELLELLCELLHERIRQVTTNKECPVELKETVSSLIWAASNCDISELAEVKKHLVRKYGAEFAKEAEENANCVVNARLYNKLSYKPPSRQLVNGYLLEIANVYKVDWVPPIELECEAVDEEAPFSTPSGYSVNMAPGSGLTAAYAGGGSAGGAGGQSAQQASAAAKLGGGVRKLSPEEQAEYEQFHKNQAKTASAPPAGGPEPIYAPVPGPPPRLNSNVTSLYSPTASTSHTAGVNGAVSGPAPASPSVVSPQALQQALQQDQQQTQAGQCQVEASAESGEDLSYSKAEPDMQYTKAELPPAAPTAAPPPPPLPPAPATSTTASGKEDPMEAMLARLAALQKN